MRSRLVYEKKVTTARTPVGEALRLGRGVCQDFAHLFIGACRGIGLPARYVSGYIHQPGEVATHAWAQVWTGRSGWIDVDPTRGTFVGDDYIKIAIGRDYSDVPPNRGVWKGRADETIAVSVKVEPIRARADRLERLVGHPGPLVGRLVDPVPAAQCSASSSARRSATASSKGSSSSSERIHGSSHRGRTRMLRNATGPWSPWSKIGPVATSFCRQTWPVGDLTSTFSWMTWPFKTTFTNRAFSTFVAVAGESWRPEGDVERLPLAGRPGRVHQRGCSLVDMMVPGQHLGPGVNSAAMTARRLGDAEAVGNLDLVESLEFDARVGPLGNQKLEMGLDVAEILAAEQVPGLARRAVDDRPPPWAGGQQLRIVGLGALRRRRPSSRRSAFARRPGHATPISSTQPDSSAPFTNGGDQQSDRARHDHCQRSERDGFHDDSMPSSRNDTGRFCTDDVQFDTA